jgi:hypothetical protein
MDYKGSDTDSVGHNAFTVSRLIQTENINSKEARRETAKAIAATITGLLHLVAGKGVMDADASKTSVNPAWRKTVIHHHAFMLFEDDNPNSEYWSELAKEGTKRI